MVTLLSPPGRGGRLEQVPQGEFHGERLGDGGECLRAGLSDAEKPGFYNFRTWWNIKKASTAPKATFCTVELPGSGFHTESERAATGSAGLTIAEVKFNVSMQTALSYSVTAAMPPSRLTGWSWPQPVTWS